MLEKISNYFKIKETNDPNQRMYYILKISLLVSCVSHFLFILLFGYFQIWEMMALNILSSLILSFGLLMNKKGKYFVAFLIIIVEIIIHAIAAVIFVGWDGSFQFFLFVIVPFYFFWPNWDLRIRLYSSLSTFLVYATLLFYSLNNSPIYSMTEVQYSFTSIFNVIVLFSTFGFFAHFYQKSVEKSEFKLKSANTRLDCLAKTDPLTRLHNRRTITEMLVDNNFERTKKPDHYSIIIGDIDNFKVINDNFGHHVGDKVLIHIAHILESGVRSEDIVSRWGGEEFLIMLPEIDGNKATEIAERIRESIANSPVEHDGELIFTTMTFGVTESVNKLTLSESIGQADQALIQGKKAGKNRTTLSFTNPVNAS